MVQPQPNKVIFGREDSTSISENEIPNVTNTRFEKAPTFDIERFFFDKFYEDKNNQIPLGGIVAYSSMEAPHQDFHLEYDLSDGHSIIVHHYRSGDPTKPMIYSYRRPINPSTPVGTNVPVIHPYNYMDPVAKSFMNTDKNLALNSLDEYNRPGMAYNPYAKNSPSKMIMPAQGTIIKNGKFNHDWDPGSDETKFSYEDESRNLYKWNGAKMEWDFIPSGEREELKAPLKNKLGSRIRQLMGDGSNSNVTPNVVDANGVAPSIHMENGKLVLKPNATHDNTPTFESEEEKKAWEFNKSLEEANNLKVIKTPYELGVSYIDPEELAEAKKAQEEKLHEADMNRNKDNYEKHIPKTFDYYREKQKEEELAKNNGKSLGNGVEVHIVDGPEDVKDGDEYEPKFSRISGMNLATGPMLRQNSTPQIEIVEEEKFKDASGNYYPELYDMRIDQLIPGHKYQCNGSIVIYAAPFEKYFDVQKCAFVDYEMEEFEDQHKVYNDLLQKEEYQNKMLLDNPNKVLAPADKLDLSEIKSIINQYGLSTIGKSGMKHKFAGSTKVEQIKNHPEWGLKVREDGSIDYGFEDYGYDYNEAEYMDELLSDDYED